MFLTDTSFYFSLVNGNFQLTLFCFFFNCPSWLFTLLTNFSPCGPSLSPGTCCAPSTSPIDSSNSSPSAGFFCACLCLASQVNRSGTLSSSASLWDHHLPSALSLSTIVKGLCAQSLSHIWFFAIPRTVCRQTPLSVGFYRQEYWNGLSFPSPGESSDTGIHLPRHLH